MTTSLGATLANCDEASLRQAISNGGTITFACDGTITLSATLIVERDTVLDGSGREVTISGANTVRVFEVRPGVRFSVRELTIADGAVVGTNGVPPGAPGQDAFGAGILNRGVLTMIDCVFRSNVVAGGNGGPITPDGSPNPGDGGAARGAAINNESGTVWATNCVFAANSCSGGHGGQTSLTLPGGRGGDASGGAFFSNGDEYVFSACRFVSNSVFGGGSGVAFGSGSTSGYAWGGAIASVNSTGVVLMTRFISNRAKGGNLAWLGTSGEGNGGAVFNSNGLFAAERCLFASNVVESGAAPRPGAKGPGSGGALANRGRGTLTENYFRNNLAVGMSSGGHGAHAFGGAVDNGGELSINGCTFDSNTAIGGNSGITAVGGWPAGNAHGGGVYSSGTLDVTNSTFVANAARGGVAFGFVGGATQGVGGGGAIGVISNSVLSHVTIASNVAVNGSPNQTLVPGRGGGIYAANVAPFLQNSVLAGNLTGSNAFGVLTDEGNNFSSDASCQFTQPGSRNNVDPRLSPMDDFGGPTPTMALLAGSPAIDAALSSLCARADQRGRNRPFGAGCDVGAFEFSPPFSVRGTIHGFKPDQGISVQSGGASTVSGPNGKYVLLGLEPGNHNVVLSSSDAVSIPNSRSVNVASDILGIDFKAYPFNGLTIDAVSAQGQTVVVAGRSGDVHEMQRSGSINGQWTSFSTNTIGPEGILTLEVPLDGAGGYLRTRRLSP